MASYDEDLYILDENEDWQVVHHQDEVQITKKEKLTRKARKLVLATKPNCKDQSEPPEVMNLRENGAVRKSSKKSLSLISTCSSEDEIAEDLKIIKKPRVTKARVTRSIKTYKRQLNSSTSSSENEDPMALRSRKLSKDITTNEKGKIKKKARQTEEKPKTKKKSVKTDEKSISKKKAVKTKATKKAIIIDQKETPKKKLVIADEQLGAIGGVEHELDTSIITRLPVLDRTSTDIDVMFECNCCYNEVPFDYMVQCSDGHLFCCHCLENYAKEAVYGHGKGELKCLKGGCEFTFPTSQICRALPENLYAKYEERMASECLNVVNLENFVKCKFCNNGAILDPQETYFACTQCCKHFCRHCEELYQDHKGLTCDQVEKDEETKLRVQYEEKMAEAKIRSCLACRSRFTKESGCNKMTCRCGKTMCYVCREPNIDYTHFCQHLRDPDIKGCAECKSCFLWSKAEDDDRLAIEEIKKEAKAARQKEGFVTDCQIGATSPSRPGADLQKRQVNSKNEHANVMAQQMPYQPQENEARNNGIEPQIPNQPQNDAHQNRAIMVPRRIAERIPQQQVAADLAARIEVAQHQNLGREIPAARNPNPRHNPVRNPDSVRERIHEQPGFAEHLNRWHYAAREIPAARYENRRHYAAREIPAATYQNPGHYAAREPQGMMYQDPLRMREPLHVWKY